LELPGRHLRKVTVCEPDVVVQGVLLCSTMDVLHCDVCDGESGWASGRSSIQVVCLNVNSIYRNIGNSDILILDVIDGACRAGVSLDPGSILRIENDGVGECDAFDRIVGLATNAPNAETMTTIAEHVVGNDVISTRNGNAIILIPDDAICKQCVGSRRAVDAIGVMSSRDSGRDKLIAIFHIDDDRPYEEVGVRGQAEDVAGRVLDK